jgi:hypothetical protein
MKRLSAWLAPLLVVAGCAKQGAGPELHEVIRQDVSPPLREIVPVPPVDRDHGDDEAKDGDRVIPHAQSPRVDDPVLQHSARPFAMTMPLRSFDGLGDGFSGPGGSFKVQYHPPDTNGAVGPNHYVQTVNVAYAIFDKSGNVLLGPSPIKTLFSGFGGECEKDNDGDPIVLYDADADRWIISQFAISGSPYYQCVAISTSPDPTGSYYRYQYSFSDMNDYPKIGVWPDGYYVTYNLFNGSSFDGAQVCAMNRAAMVAGSASATQQCFSAGSSWGGMLASHVDGHSAPPAGSPSYVLSLGDTDLGLWRFHVDWTTPANSRLDGPTHIAVASFNAFSGSVTQPGGGSLDTLSDRLMYRLAYRHFADHESLVVNHTVDASSSQAGVRWYEIRDPGGSPQVFQQGTYSPDAENRWMGSVAMDHDGNLAVGFSAGSSSTYPGLRYAGRTPGDPLGTLGQGETTLVAGSSSQSSVSRWGDYSSLTVDPVDDCTFWFTSEYMAGSEWHTRVGSFKFPSCGGAVTDDFSISVAPSSVTVAAGGTATLTVSTTLTAGAAQAISLSVGGLPAGVTASFNPASVMAGGSSTLTITAASGAASATAALSVSATGQAVSHAATLQLTLQGSGTSDGNTVVNGDFEAGTLSGWSASGVTQEEASTPHSGSQCGRVGDTNPYNGDSSLSQTVHVPASGTTTLSFFYNLHCPDTIQYDWQLAEIHSPSGAVLKNIFKVCQNDQVWTQATVDLTPYHGQDVVLFFGDHDDGYAGDPTYMLIDDVATTTR